MAKENIKTGYSYIPCFECEGTGWWSYGPPGIEGYCVNCKGTGEILINC